MRPATLECPCCGGDRSDEDSIAAWLTYHKGHPLERSGRYIACVRCHSSLWCAEDQLDAILPLPEAPHDALQKHFDILSAADKERMATHETLRAAVREVVTRLRVLLSESDECRAHHTWLEDAHAQLNALTAHLDGTPVEMHHFAECLKTIMEG